MKIQNQEQTGSWRLLNRYYILTFLLNILISSTQQLFGSTLTLHVDAMGHSTAISGTIMSAACATAFFYRIFGGRLADRFGRRNTLVAGLLILTVAHLMCGVVKTLPLLYLFSIIKMVGFSMSGTSAAIMAVDVTPRERMSEGIGYFGLGGTLSQALGPSLAVAVYATQWAFMGTMTVAAAFAAVGIPLVLLFGGYERNAAFPGNRLESIAAPAVRSRRRSLREWFWDLIEKSALPATLAAFCGAMAASVITIYLTHYAATSGIGNAGVYFICTALSMVAARLLTGRLADRYGTLICVLPGYAMIAIALLLLPFSPDARPLFYLSGVLNGFGQGMTTPALNAAAIRATSPERRSAASSTFLLQGDLSIMAGSSLWGSLIDRLGYTSVFFTATVFAGIGILLSIVFFRKEQRQSA